LRLPGPGGRSGDTAGGQKIFILEFASNGISKLEASLCRFVDPGWSELKSLGLEGMPLAG
jgi:hypothetical protein